MGKRPDKNKEQDRKIITNPTSPFPFIHKFITWQGIDKDKTLSRAPCELLALRGTQIQQASQARLQSAQPPIVVPTEGI